MCKRIQRLVFVFVLYSFSLYASSIRLNVVQASEMDTYQWEAVNNLWIISFYNAYKNIPFDQLDDNIKDASKEALFEYLQHRFDKYHAIALQNPYSFVLAYNDQQLAGYTLYHMLEQQTIIHIDHFAVHPNCQGMGIGKKLLESTIKSKPEIRGVVLTTRILNKDAQSFYRKQGFYKLYDINGLVFDPKYSILLRKDVKN